MSNKHRKICSIALGEDVKILEPLYTLSRNVKWYGVVENSIAVPQKPKNRFTI